VEETAQEPVEETAQALVDRLVAAGEWPEPGLLEAILARGAEAREPLLEVVRREPQGWPEDAPIDFATDLLGSLRDPAALPAVVELFRRFDDEMLESVYTAVGALGPAAIEPALAISRDPTLGWYPRAMAVNAALRAAGDDLASRARIAEVLREELAGFLARAGELEGDDFDLVSSLVCDLSDLADPAARDLIRKAFEADIVDTFIIDPKTVEEIYRRGGEVPRDDHDDWLRRYRSHYQEHQDWLRRPRPAETWPSFVEPEPLAPAPPPETVRYTEHRPGRNDPCWCGSGKKYKKCHLSQDQAQG
jgi:hypothetical protein